MSKFKKKYKWKDRDYHLLVSKRRREMRFELERDWLFGVKSQSDSLNPEVTGINKFVFTSVID